MLQKVNAMVIVLEILLSLVLTLPLSSRASTGDAQYTYVILVIDPPFSARLYWRINSLRVDSNTADFPLDLDFRLITLNELRWSPGTQQDINQISKRPVVMVFLGEIELFKNFPFVGVLTKKEHIPKLHNLPNVKYSYELPRSLVSSYVRLLRNFDQMIEDTIPKLAKDNIGFVVVNISLQLPPVRNRIFDPYDPLILATKMMVDRGVLLVVAAGNFGGFGNNTMSCLAVNPWVISVGATYSDGKTLWEKSSRGIPGDPVNHPTVVAPASSPGTSLATAEISAIAAKCAVFINETLSNSSAVAQWHSLLANLGLEPEAVVASPKTVTRMIEDMAQDIPGYDKHEVGAGLVDSTIAKAYFKSFNLSNFLKVFAPKANVNPQQ